MTNLTAPEMRVRCERITPDFARAVRYMPGETTSTPIGFIRMANEWYYPYELGANGVRYEPTHRYRQQSHAMRHLLTGEPGEEAVSLERPETYGINVPFTRPMPPMEMRDPWEKTAA